MEDEDIKNLFNRVIAQNPKCTYDIVNIAEGIAGSLSGDINSDVLNVVENAQILHLGALAFEIEGGNIFFEKGALEICKIAYGCGEIILPFFDVIWSGYWKSRDAEHYSHTLDKLAASGTGGSYIPSFETIIKVCEEEIPIFSRRKNYRRTEEEKARETERKEYREKTKATLRGKYATLIKNSGPKP